MNHTHTIFLALAALAVSAPTFAAGADRAPFRFPRQARAIIDKELLSFIAAGLAGETIDRIKLRGAVAALEKNRSKTTQPHRTEHRGHGTRNANHGSTGRIVEILSQKATEAQQQAAAQEQAAAQNRGNEQRHRR